MARRVCCALDADASDSIAGTWREAQLPNNPRWPARQPRVRPHDRLRQREPADVRARAPALVWAHDPIPRGERRRHDAHHADDAHERNGAQSKAALRGGANEAHDTTQIKYYLEGSGSDPSAIARLLPQVVRELGEEWMEAKANGLGMP
jgi:hypothetical protein